MKTIIKNKNGQELYIFKNKNDLISQVMDIQRKNKEFLHTENELVSMKVQDIAKEYFNYEEYDVEVR